MSRLSYEIIAAQAFRLITAWAVAPHHFYDEAYSTYLLFITACGWSDNEFDKETLKRIDASWDNNNIPNYLSLN